MRILEECNAYLENLKVREGRDHGQGFYDGTSVGVSEYLNVK
jgi:hypothetical protein